MTDVDTRALPLNCACGAVRGRVLDANAAQGDHVVCHCADCQAFATYFGAGARILRPDGGTALYQSRCARLRIDAGVEHLACLHLTDKPTLRWYAACCATPMFNTYARGGIPYITTLLGNVSDTAALSAIGPVKGHLFLPPPMSTSDTRPRMAMATLMRRFFVRMVKDLVSGDRRRSALFDPATLAPISPPRRLSAAERRAIPVIDGV